MCIHIYGSWLAISSSKSMNNVKPDCSKVVDFFIPFPHPSWFNIFKKSYTLGNRLLFFYDFLKCLLLFWSGRVGLLVLQNETTALVQLSWLWKLVFWDRALITGAKVEKEGGGQRWAPRQGGNRIQPHRSGPKAAPAPKEPPAVAVTWQGLGSNFWSIPLLPWPLKTVLHSSTAGTLQEKSASNSNANALPGFPLPRVSSDNSRPRKDGLASLCRVWASSKPQILASSRMPEARSPNNWPQWLHLDKSELGITLQSVLSPRRNQKAKRRRKWKSTRSS